MSKKPVIFTVLKNHINLASKFALVTKTRNNKIKIYSQSYCREIIHSRWVGGGKRIILIASKWKLNEKIKQIENKLNLRIKSEQIGLVTAGIKNTEYYYLIYVSPFWRQCDLFKSLFTAILNGDNYFTNKREKNNLKRFMDGKISFHPKYYFCQWREANYNGLKFITGKCPPRPVNQY